MATETEENNAHPDAEYLQEYSKELTDILNKSNEQFEKQLSYISAGALGLSFIIIEKVLKNVYETQYKSLLIIGWAFLILTLLVNLLSHLYAVRVHYNTLVDINEHLSGGNDLDYKRIEKCKNKIEGLNFVSIISLILGIILIVVYTSINITNHV